MNTATMRTQMRDGLRAKGLEALADHVWLLTPAHIEELNEYDERRPYVEIHTTFRGEPYLLAISDNVGIQAPADDDWLATLQEGSECAEDTIITIGFCSEYGD